MGVGGRMNSASKGENVDRAVEAVSEEGDQLGKQFGMMIGKALKAHYDDLVDAPVPSKFLDLLAQLESSQDKKS